MNGLQLNRGAPGVRQPFSFRSAAGWLAVVGANGVGKSSLLLSLAGLMQAPSAQVAIAVFGQGHAVLMSIDRLSTQQRAQAIAWMGQSETIDGRWLAKDIIGLGRLPWRDQARQTQIVTQTFDDDDAWIHALALEPLMSRRVDELSGGERQRVLIARALAVKAPVTLLDEPSLHLDPTHQFQLAAWLAGSRQRGRLVVTATHDLNLALNADAILLLARYASPIYASAQDQAIHRAIESEMEGAVRISRISLSGQDHWYALPERAMSTAQLTE